MVDGKHIAIAFSYKHLSSSLLTYPANITLSGMAIPADSKSDFFAPPNSTNLYLDIEDL